MIAPAASVMKRIDGLLARALLFIAFARADVSSVHDDVHDHRLRFDLGRRLGRDSIALALIGPIEDNLHRPVIPHARSGYRDVTVRHGPVRVAAVAGRMAEEISG